MKNQKGFTSVELAIVLAFVTVVLGVGGTAVWVIGHFLTKFW